MLDSEGLCASGGGGTENRSFDLEDVIPSDLGGGQVSSHFEAHFYIFYNLNSK